MIYLNNAATSFPKPPGVIDAVKSYLSSVPYHSSRSGFSGGVDVVERCRGKLGQLFGIPGAGRVVFTSGGTESLNLAILGMGFSRDHVITTMIEHNSVLRPLKHLEREGRVELTIVGCDAAGNVLPADIEAAIRTNTRAIVVNHCSNVTGQILDVVEIGRIARRRRVVFIVDASQSAGVIPLDVDAASIDLLAFTGHKSLMALTGVGGLYIREGIQLQPLKYGGTGVRSDLLFQPEELPLYYEAGTQNLAGIVSLHAGLDFIAHVGLDCIHEKRVHIIQAITEKLSHFSPVVLYGQSPCNPEATILSFNIDGIPPEDVGYILENSFDIVCRTGLHCAPLIHQALGSSPGGSVRISPSYFTTELEVKKFIDAVRYLCTAVSPRKS